MGKNILITPTPTGTTNPSIAFSGATAKMITLEILSGGTLAFNSTGGTMMSIDDTTTGSLYSVNDISGLPILEVFSDDRLIAGKYNANTLYVSGTNLGFGTTGATGTRVDIHGLGSGSTNTIGLQVSDSAGVPIFTVYDNATTQVSGNFTVTGTSSLQAVSVTTISATTYYGDGSNLSGISANDYYTTAVTLNDSTLFFDRNDTLSAYSINLSGITVLADKYWISGTTGINSIQANNLTGLLSNGDYSLAYGNATSAYTEASHAEGKQTYASGIASHTEGYQTTSISDYSHAEGYQTTAGYKGFLTINPDSIIDGCITLDANYLDVTGEFSSSTIVYVGNSDAVFELTISSLLFDDPYTLIYTTASALTLSDAFIVAGDANFNSPLATDIIGRDIHAEGNGTIAFGFFSHAEGGDTKAYGRRSHAEGDSTSALNRGAHSEGINAKAYGMNSHAEGAQTTTSGTSSHAEGYVTTTIGSYSHAEGQGTTASGVSSHAEGYTTTAIGSYSHAEGQETTSNGVSNHAEGYITTAIGLYSHAEGQGTTAIGDYSHAEGYGEFGQYLTTSGKGSHAEGFGSTTYGDYSHAEGSATKTIGQSSHSEGAVTTAMGDYSHTEGYNTTAIGSYSHVSGQYNSSNSDYSSIIAGSGNTMDITAEGSVIIGGLGINATLSYTTYVSYINVQRNISAGTIFSGSTDLSNLFASQSTTTSLQNQLNTKANLSGATFTGNVNAGVISATTISATTYYGNGSNLTGVLGDSTIRTISTSQSALSSDSTLVCTAALTLTLPTAVGIDGKKYVIKSRTTSTITIITTGGQIIDDDTTQYLTSKNASITVQSNGANWIII